MLVKTKTVKTHFCKIFLGVKEVKEVKEVKSRYTSDAVCFHPPNSTAKLWAFNFLNSLPLFSRFFFSKASARRAWFCCRQEVCGKFTFPSSCATELVLENNKLSRSVFEVLVCIGLNNKEYTCVIFWRKSMTFLCKKSVPSGLVLTVPSFQHLLVLRIPLSGTPSTTGR